MFDSICSTCIDLLMPFVWHLMSAVCRYLLKVCKLSNADENVVLILARCLPHIVPNVLLNKREVSNNLQYPNTRLTPASHNLSSITNEKRSRHSTSQKKRVRWRM